MAVATISHVDRDQRFGEIVCECLQAADRGEILNREQLLANHPDFFDELADFLTNLENVEQMAMPARAALGPTANTYRYEGLAAGVLGDFQIIREVGRGGMGIVYEAQQVSLNRRVALKVLPFAATMDPRHLQRFKNEALAAASLEHPNIVPVYGVGCERGVHFYAMKFIDGRPLTHIIRPPSENPKVAPPEAETVPAARAATVPMPHDPGRFRRIAEWGIQAAEALEHAHSMGIVHRDIKPGNFMIDEQGKLWVTDFGLAKMGTDAGVTMTGDVLGTLRYMSPEQALAKHGLVDHRTDIYALGATLYELLTGQPAVPGEDKQKVLNRIAFEESAKPRAINAAISRDLETVVLKCLEKESFARYQSAGELAADLRRWSRDEPIKAQRERATDRLWKWVRRRPAIAALMSLLILSLLTLAVGAMWTSAKLRISANRARAQRDQARVAVDDMYSRVAEEWLAQKPGLQPLQREFLLKALAYYQSVGKDDDDPIETWMRGQAFLRVGAIQTKFGAFADAEVALKKAIEILDSPDIDGEREHLAGDAWARQSIIFIQTGRMHQAIEAGRRAVEIRRRVASRPLAPIWARIELGESTRILGMAIRHSNSSESETMIREARSVFEAINLADPGNARGMLGLVNLALDAGRILYNRDDFAGAVTEFTQGAVSAEELVKLHPDNPDHWSSLAKLQYATGTTNYKLDRRPESMKALDRAKELLQRLAIDFPDLPEYRCDLALTIYVRASVLWDLGRRTEAVDAHRQSIQVKERMVVEFPQVVDYRQDLIHSLYGLGDAYIHMNQPADAEQALNRARDLAEQLTREHNTPEYRKDLARVHTALAAVKQFSGKPVEVIALYERALAISDHADILVPVAAYFASCPDPALRNPERAVELARRAANEAPQGQESIPVLGEALFRAGRPAEAIAALEKAVQIVGPKPSTLAILAMCHWDLGQQREAQRYLNKARERMTGGDALEAENIRWMTEATKHMVAEYSPEPISTKPNAR